jgi:hypothetical protein
MERKSSLYKIILLGMVSGESREFGLVKREFAWLMRFPVLMIPSAKILEWHLQLHFLILDVVIQLSTGIQRNVYAFMDTTSWHTAAFLDVCSMWVIHSLQKFGRKAKQLEINVGDIRMELCK